LRCSIRRGSPDCIWRRRGWYCLPDESLAFPAGLAAPVKAPLAGARDLVGAMRARLDAYLRLPLRL